MCDHIARIARRFAVAVVPPGARRVAGELLVNRPGYRQRVACMLHRQTGEKLVALFAPRARQGRRRQQWRQPRAVIDRQRQDRRAGQLSATRSRKHGAKAARIVQGQALDRECGLHGNGTLRSIGLFGEPGAHLGMKMLSYRRGSLHRALFSMAVQPSTSSRSMAGVARRASLACST